MVIFHKYFIFKQTFENDSEKYLACAACIFLSAKVCNQLIPLEELVKYFLKQYVRQCNIALEIDSQLIFETGERLCLIEFDILSSLGFDLNIEIPYKYIQNMKSYYFDYLKNPKLIIITTNLINDSFKLPLCLKFDPLLIALACLYLASVYFKVPLVDTKEGLKWFQLIDKKVELNEVLPVAERINRIFKLSNEGKLGYTQGKSNLQRGDNIIKFDSARRNQSNLDVKANESDVEMGVVGGN